MSGKRMRSFPARWTRTCAALVVAAPLPAGAPAPPPWQPSQADICAVAAANDPFGGDEKVSADAWKRRNAIRDITRWHSAAWGVEDGVLIGPWGKCPFRGVGFNALFFSDDGRFAMTEWGSEPAPLGGAWGDCVFEKLAGRWQLLGCATTRVS